MKKIIKTIFCMAAFAVLAISCQKENNGVEPVADVKGTIEININGLMGEYTQVDATKSSLVNTVRVSWENGDIVYVYDGTQCLGSLVASIEGAEDRYAILSTDENHTVTAPAAGTKLTLVHSPLLTEAPAVSDGEISISLANQSGTKAPFVAYATLDYNNEESINNALVPFKFATSVIKVNCTCLNANTAITSATLSNVNTACKLSLSGTAAPTVAGDVNGTITRTNDSYFAAEKVNSEGVAVFQLAVPKLQAATESRVLTVEQGSAGFEYMNFSKKSLDAATSVNTVCQLTGEVRVENVTLDKTELILYRDETTTLTATVYPDNASNKSVTWSSSDEGVATVDASGLVTTVSFGTATIIATTIDGFKTAVCTVIVRTKFQQDKFSVSEDKQVYFSPGNLWADATDPENPVFKFEYNQYDFSNTWRTSHVSHFIWSKFANEAVKEEDYDSEYSDGDVLFTNSTAESANPDFTVDGQTGKYRTLSENEWDYLLNTRVVNGGSGKDKSYSLNITYNGITGLVLYPDDFSAPVLNAGTQYTDENFPIDCAFIPAAGIRSLKEISYAGKIGFYHLSGVIEDGYYSATMFDSEEVAIVSLTYIFHSSVRLVTDVTE